MATTTTHAPLPLAPSAAKNQGLGEMVSTLVGSEILRIAGEVRTLVAEGKPVLNLTVGDFAPGQFQSFYRQADFTGANRGGADDQRTIRDGRIHRLEYLSRPQNCRGADGGPSLVPGDGIGRHQPETQEPEIGHRPGSRSNVQRVARVNQDHVQSVRHAYYTNDRS